MWYSGAISEKEEKEMVETLRDYEALLFEPMMFWYGGINYDQI
jgi:hypothetical protein